MVGVLFRIISLFIALDDDEILVIFNANDNKAHLIKYLIVIQWWCDANVYLCWDLSSNLK